MPPRVGTAANRLDANDSTERRSPVIATPAIAKATSMGRMRTESHLRQLNGKPSLFIRLLDRWQCRTMSATRARYDRAVADVQAILEESVRMGDLERAGRLLDLFEVAAACPVVEGDPLYQACRADVEEDLAELEHRRHRNRQTAKRWMEAMGREARANLPAMATLRREFA
jgi:hypothetical protein